MLRLLVLAVVASPVLAVGQDFTMTVTQPYPAAVDQGQDARSYINVGTVNGFNGTVSFTCAVTPAVQNGPVCTPTATATPPQQIAMSITTSNTVGTATPAGLYSLTVTGVAGAQTVTVPLSLTVLSVVPAYTLAVTTAITPTSVAPGYPATAVVTVFPVNGYSGTVTLSCRTITPVATPAPSCSFSPAAVAVPGPSSTLTITTTGNTAPPPASGMVSPPVSPGGSNGTWPHGPAVTGLSTVFFGFGLIAVAFGVAGQRRRKLCGLCLLVLTAACFLMPACAPPNNSNTGLNGSTPKNTYVFTLTGADTNGVAPSNEATPATVSLIVN